MTRRLLAGAALLLWLPAVPAVTGELDAGDFAQIFRLGGAERIAGGPYTLQEGTPFPVLPNLDTPANPLGQNSYIWGLAWFHDPNLPDSSLYAGTARNVLCLLGSGGFGGADDSCPEPTENALLPIPRYPEDAAQIWRYDPSATQGGIEGTWTQIWESPEVDNSLGCLLEFEVPEEGLDFAAILQLLGCLIAGPDGAYPATVGIRNLAQCDAGGTNHLYAAGLGLFGKIYVLNDAGTSFVEASAAGATFTEIDILGSILDGMAVEELSALFETIDLGYRALVCWDPPSGPTVLCTAPSGSILDPDGSAHPWVLCNEDPSDTTSPWEPYSELGFGTPNPVGLFDMTTVTVQEPASMGSGVVEYLCASDINRVDGGSVWCTNGTGCDIGVGDEFDSHACVWTEVVANGMWRPADFFGDGIGSGNGREENASAFGFGPYDNDGDGIHDYLYYGMADAAGGPTADNENAELGRIDLRGIIVDSELPLVGPSPAAPTDNPNFLHWQLMAGVPRVTVLDGCSPPDPPDPPDDTPCEPETTVHSLARLEADGMICTEVELLEEDLGGTNQDIPDETMGCRPLSGLGNGLAENESADDNDGPAQYIWRFAQHQGDLFMGILNTGGGGGRGDSGGGEPGGFNLYKTSSDSDGVVWELVTNDAFGWGETSYGVRTLVSTDPTPGLDDATPTGPWVSAALGEPALFVGVANPYGPGDPAGGAQVYMSSQTAFLPPEAIATGALQAIDDELCVAYDDCTPPGDGVETMSLDGSSSFAPLSTATIVAWTWYLATGIDCVTPPAADASGVTYAPALAAGFPYMDHPFTLRVVDDGGGDFDCSEYSARVWGNARPFATLETVPPARPNVSGGGGGGGSSSRGRLYLVDWDGDGEESFQLTVRCQDPDSAIQACIKDFDDVGTAYFFPQAALLEDSVKEFTAMVRAVDMGSSTPNLDLYAIDEWADEYGPYMEMDFDGDIRIDDRHPFVARAGVDVDVIPFADVPATNDPPVCGTGTVVALKNTTLQYDPNNPTPGYPRLCADPDEISDGTPATLVYEVDSATGSENPDAGDGFLDGAATVHPYTDLATELEYIPGTDEFGLDYFVYEAGESTDTSYQSTEVPLFVRVIECTLGSPVVYAVVDGEDPVSPTTREACIAVIATDSSVESSTVFTAGEYIEIGNGFSVDAGVDLTLELDPSLITGG